MKNLAATALVLFFSATYLFAQTTNSPTTKEKKPSYYIAKHTVLLTGHIGFTFGKSDNLSAGNAHSAQLQFSERSGCFVANNLAMGVSVEYNFNYNKEKGYGTLPSGSEIFTNRYRHTILPGYFLRYYKMFTPKLGIYGQFNAACLVALHDTYSNDVSLINKDQYLGFRLGAAPGLLYLVSKRVAIEASFGSITYDYQRDLNSSNVSHSGGLSFNPNLNFGLSLYLGKGVQQKVETKPPHAAF